jgi:hypothetical protein
MGNFFSSSLGLAGSGNTATPGSPGYMPFRAQDNGYKQTPMPQYSGVTPSMALATQGYGGSVLPGGALGDQMAAAAKPAVAAAPTAPGAMQPIPTLGPSPTAAAFGGRSIYG